MDAPGLVGSFKQAHYQYAQNGKAGADSGHSDDPSSATTTNHTSGTSDLARHSSTASSSSSRSGSPRRGGGGVRKNVFQPRMSRLDFEKLHVENSEYRGFFVLFWISLVTYVTTTVYQNMLEEGVPITGNLFTQGTKDFLVLALADVAMILFTFSVVPVQIALKNSWIPRTVGYLARHVLLIILCFIGVGLPWIRNWPWLQSGSFFIHGLVLGMKMHSYLAYNGDLESHRRELVKLKNKIGQGKKSDDTDSATSQVMDQQKILTEKLTQGSTVYPNNVTFANFWDFLLIPTLVYELEYPRTPAIRVKYLLEKAAATIGSCGVLYLTGEVEHYIWPVFLSMPHISLSEALVKLLFPFMIGYIMIFHIIWECILNFFAEITRFADRDFYDDWWNSTSFDEYARKWNKVVHEWLLRHVYLEAIDKYKVSKINATFLTFFLSSCLHEMVMIVIGRRIRMYLFFLQMFQIPLIMVGRLPIVKRHKLIGNIFFWVSMFLGPPLLAVVYCHEHFTENYRS